MLSNGRWAKTPVLFGTSRRLGSLTCADVDVHVGIEPLCEEGVEKVQSMVTSYFKDWVSSLGFLKF